MPQPDFSEPMYDHSVGTDLRQADPASSRRTAMTTARVTLPLDNLGCGGGETLTIERALAKMPGVTEVYINPLTEMAYIIYDPAQVHPEQLRATLARLGYGAPPATAQHEPAIASMQPKGRSRHLYWQAIMGGVALGTFYNLIWSDEKSMAFRSHAFLSV
jgi:cation transport ATPase